MELAIASEPSARHPVADATWNEALAPGVSLLGVADGFGPAGRESATARLALSSVRDYLRRRQRVNVLLGKSNSASTARTMLLHALEHANERLFASNGTSDDFVAGGASITTALIVGRHVFIGHVGDTRAYLLRLGRLESLTADDAMFVNPVSSSKSMVPAKPRVRGLLWRCLGTQPRLEATVAHVELLPGDQLVLCTDGLHQAVFPEELEQALVESDTAEQAVTRLVMTERIRGAHDCASIIVGRDLMAPQTPLAHPHGGRALAVRLGLAVAFMGLLALASWLALTPH